jgi:predicted permease
MGLFPPPRERKLRLVEPSARTIFAFAIVLATGIALSILYLFVNRTEQGFVDLIVFSVITSAITFVAGYAIDIIEQS